MVDRELNHSFPTFPSLHTASASSTMEDLEIVVLQRAFRTDEKIIVYRLTSPSFQGKSIDFMIAVAESVRELVRTKLEAYRALKIQFLLTSQWYCDSTKSLKEGIANTAMMRIDTEQDFDNVLATGIEKIKERESDINNLTSEWIFMRVLHLDVHMNKLTPAR